jgi:MoxR-like ATPase
MSQRLVCTDDLTSGDIMGTWMPAGERWTFKEGPAIRAWRGRNGEGGRLVVDEVDRLSGDGLAQLLNVTDSELSARWTNPDTLEEVGPGPQFSVIMTTNATDLWEIPAALRDRFPLAIPVDMPPLAAVERLSADLQPAAFASARETDAERRVSLRSLFQFDDLRNALGPQRAAELVFGEEQARSFIDALAIDAVASPSASRGFEL